MTFLKRHLTLICVGAAAALAAGVYASASPSDPAAQSQRSQDQQILMTEVQLSPTADAEAAADARAVIAAMDLSNAQALGDIETKLGAAGVDAKVYTFAMSTESAAVLNGDVQPIVVDRQGAAASKIIVSKAPSAD